MKVWLLLAACLVACTAEAVYGNEHQAEDNFNIKTAKARAVAHASAVADEARVAKLNAEVFPTEPATSHWHHETSSQMQAHWKSIADSTLGVDPAAHHAVAPKPAAHVKHAAKATHGKAHAPAHGKKGVSHLPPKPTAEEQAAAEERAHAKLTNEAFPESKEPKWHQESSAAELSHLAAVAGNSLPSDKKAALPQHVESAAEMQSEHKKEVNAAFPKRWAKQEHQAQVVGKVNWHKKALEKKEKMVDSKVFGAHTFRKMDLKHKLMASEQETHEERAKAAQAGSSELAHLNQINDQVFPHAAVVHKPLKSVQKHAAHKAAMHTAAPHHKAAIKQQMHAVDPHHPMESKNQMPPSSDTEVPAVGTDIVYMGAHQAGFASKEDNHVTHKAKGTAAHGK